jgi:hypothetical protein
MVDFPQGLDLVAAVVEQAKADSCSERICPYLGHSLSYCANEFLTASDDYLQEHSNADASEYALAFFEIVEGLYGGARGNLKSVQSGRSVTAGSWRSVYSR